LKFQELIEWDETTSKKLQIVETDHSLKPLAVIFAHSGDSWFWFVGLVIVFLVGNPFWRHLTLTFILSFIPLAVIVLWIKFTIRRKRPEGEWGKIYRITDPHSFPSGHAARAYLFATLAIGLGPVWFAILLFLWAPLVCLARVLTGVHYISDVIAGLIVGIFSGLFILAILPLIEPLLQLLMQILPAL
jgi:undecaprenyl-diphosphatase